MARRRKILWLIYPSYIAITLVALLAVGWYAASALKQVYINETAEDLLVRARLIEVILHGKISAADAGEVNRICRRIGPVIATRITVILPSGLVIADTDEDPALMENHQNRPEILEAYAAGTGRYVRHSHTLNKDMMYVSLAVYDHGVPLGVIRTSRPVATLAQTLQANYARIAAAGFIVAVLAIAISWLVARTFTRTLADLRQGALIFASGDLDHRLRLPESTEFSALADTMNQMASELSERIRTVTAQRNELAAMLAGMTEAVLVVDMEERLVRVNQAGARLFSLDPDEVQGRKVEETMRNAALLQFISRALAAEAPLEDEIVIYQDGEERFLQAHGNVVRDSVGQKTHALVVMNDVTRLKRLEQVRRDFVANVSHELRTPLTSIKGFVDTLKDGALDDPASARKFLDIVSRHTDRLNAIIEDLLALSRLERDEDTGDVVLLAPAPVKEVLASAVADVQDQAAAKGIAIRLQCPDDLAAPVNPPLLEQAVANLLDNAVKYSPPGSPVSLTAERADMAVTITVTDHGPGIPLQHLPRIFERFYRVDQARSRSLGGTGLGLAIVKHIVSAHHAHISVQSSEGQGSSFTITIPLPPSM